MFEANNYTYDLKYDWVMSEPAKDGTFFHLASYQHQLAQTQNKEEEKKNAFQNSKMNRLQGKFQIIIIVNQDSYANNPSPREYLDKTGGTPLDITQTPQNIVPSPAGRSEKTQNKEPEKDEKSVDKKCRCYLL